MRPFHPAAGELISLGRFTCVGLSGLAVNTCVLWLLTEHVGVYYLVSALVATEVAILSNFALNHAWTFASRPGEERLLMKAARFNLISLGGLMLTTSALFCLTTFAGLHYLLANVVAVGAGAGWNYAANRRWTWPDAASSSSLVQEAFVSELTLIHAPVSAGTPRPGREVSR